MLAPSAEETELIATLLGRKPQPPYEVAVRHDDGTPRVLRNGPIKDNGTPMPTLYWLVSPTDRLVVSRIESNGGVDRSEAAIGLEALAEVHRRYEAERDQLMPADHVGPAPSGGVGGTRIGVKCLHAHYAWYLAGGDDPVGQWVADRLAEGEGEKHAHPKEETTP